MYALDSEPDKLGDDYALWSVSKNISINERKIKLTFNNRSRLS